jgi:hypothetical protein
MKFSWNLARNFFIENCQENAGFVKTVQCQSHCIRGNKFLPLVLRLLTDLG